MSAENALSNIHLEAAGRWGHTEYSLGYHREYLARLTGLASDDPGFHRAAWDRLALDFLWLTNDGLVDWKKTGRTTDLGHAVYAVDGSDRRPPSVSPFHGEAEVWAFDAGAEYGLPDFDAQIRAYERLLEDSRRAFPNQLIPGGYYKTIISGAIEAFGWEPLLLAAAEPDRMEKVLDTFFRRTRFFMEAWARTSARVIIQHDDFTWTAGPFLSPGFCRRVLIPRYAELWKPLHAAGQKVLFCSDGRYQEFIPDLAAAGADGFIFEPVNDFAWLAANFGEGYCLVGSDVDCRDLAAGHWEKAEAGLRRTFRALERCRGAILAVGNHLPPGLPEAMLNRYFDFLLPRLAR
ncbi:MAG TPA: uroporphyrinogen decarboxylase family protein [bacterium]|uniref:Uroporphyrinogen decarboxylase (URO-D) n=1 Tax=candidate division TA06 bacterium ADurb.Bin417 TaxID=1852828 RepID=A0A1V5MJ62_UNCT6|nr:MAG: Uroporphyrinogen decarboxylase (URO-D) [candidate division TA06 bacterium ADurb.Bin417]HNQ35570.1 uroporphyrinogen decarboxylase family protein [bacterium]HNS48318.1 uroporphyrinogen decarboxylase family protein [bacterium]